MLEGIRLNVIFWERLTSGDLDLWPLS